MLPILISNPHAGLSIAPEVEAINLLTPEEIFADGDEGAREIYALEDHVQAFLTTDIARAYVDLNRHVDDRREDGIVKTCTCWQVPIYSEPLSEDLIQDLLAKYYHPYHEKLRELASEVVLGLDCHTMAAKGPPIGPDPDVERPLICLSNGAGTTCPEEWLHTLAEDLGRSFKCEVSLNDPFQGGFITRSHASELPWIQLELSRAHWTTFENKRQQLLDALTIWCARH